MSAISKSGRRRALVGLFCRLLLHGFRGEMPLRFCGGAPRRIFERVSTTEIRSTRTPASHKFAHSTRAITVPLDAGRWSIWLAGCFRFFALIQYFDRIVAKLDAEKTKLT
jgi:hypothetical protein